MPLIGVSIALPDASGEVLQSYRLGLGDLTAVHIPSHITLLPPVEVGSPEQEQEMDEHLTRIAAEQPPFRVHLRGTGTFRPVSPVVFVNLVEGIGECELLARAVTSGPVGLEAEFPYHPHVTIAHHLDDEVMDRAFEEMADFEDVFEVDCFWLYVFDETLGWQKARSFALG